MKKAYIFLFLCSLLSSLLPAQDYFGDDLPFFQKKAKLYQRWLDANGLGEALRVDKVELKKNGMELELFLTLRTADPDTAASLWASLEVGFAAQNPDLDLGAILFDTFARLMEIPPAQGNVQVYIPRRGGPGYDPCFYIWLWDEDGQPKQERRINNCKAQPLSIAVRPVAVRAVAAGTPVAVSGRQRAQEVFDDILEYARQRYEHLTCEKRDTPRVEEDDRSDYMLRFSVTDLCREVLTEEKKSIWCRFVELWWGPCNDMRRERLEFVFFYNSTDEGYQLTGQLTGKFGSGVYRPRTSGYMDMEPDFEEDFLKPYVRNFQRDLKRYLESK